MFETIVWATDGSEFADSVLPLVTDLASAHGSKIVTVHVDERYSGGRSNGAPVLADEDELRAKITEQVADLSHAGFTAVFEVETTQRHDTAESIAEVATKNQADLIVIGTHGRGALASAVVGSVAKRLLHVAHCPVLAVPPARDTENSIERREFASARAYATVQGRRALSREVAPLEDERRGDRGCGRDSDEHADVAQGQPVTQRIRRGIVVEG